MMAAILLQLLAAVSAILDPARAHVRHHVFHVIMPQQRQRKKVAAMLAELKPAIK